MKLKEGPWSPLNFSRQSGYTMGKGHTSRAMQPRAFRWHSRMLAPWRNDTLRVRA